MKTTSKKRYNVSQTPSSSTVTSNPYTRPKKEEDPTKETVTLPYVADVTEEIGRILRHHDIRTSFRMNRTIRTILPTPKLKTELENQGVSNLVSQLRYCLYFSDKQKTKRSY